MLVVSSMIVTAGGPEAEAARLLDVLEVELDVELVGREDAHADPAGDRRLGLAALPDSTGMLLDQLAGCYPQGKLDADLFINMALTRSRVWGRSFSEYRST